MIELTVGLPVWKSKEIVWLAMENLCNQIGINFEWELIIAEEQQGAFGTLGFSDYLERLKKVGCKRVAYVPLEYKIGLTDKWRLLGRNASDTSKVFVFHAADDYPPANKLKMAYDAINAGSDWVAYKKYLLYDLKKGRTILFDADTVNWMPGNIVATKIDSIKTLPDAYIEKGVDKWLFNCINPTNIFYDNSDNYLTGFCTDGENTISKDRKKNFERPELPFMFTGHKADVSVLNKKPQGKVVSSENVEFGYELISALPYAYKLFKEGKLKGTRSAIDTECLYFFSPKHEVDKRARGWENMKGAKHIPNIAIHRPSLDWEYFEAPPLKDHYKNDRFVFEKPIICICNRVNVEWGKSVINYFDKECLAKMFKALSVKYQIIYFNIEGRKEFYDGAEPVSIGDFELAKKYAINIHDLHKKNKDISFNTLQLMVMANCESFITMNGGYSILASYFGGTNIIYSKECREIEGKNNSFYRWYHKFGGSRIIHTDNYEDLHERINDVFVKETPLINVILRTHNRPEMFKVCYDSIKGQTHKNVNIIAGADNDESERYLTPYKCRQIRYAPNADKGEKKDGYGVFFPFNHYINLLKEEVKDGWYMGLDDDDMLMDNKAFEKIVSKIKSEDDLILWRVKFGEQLIPSDANFGKEPVAKDISGIGFMCHIKHLRNKEFTPYRRADFRWISELYKELNPVWIDEPFTCPQTGECNYGKPIKQEYAEQLL